MNHEPPNYDEPLSYIINKPEDVINIVIDDRILSNVNYPTQDFLDFFRYHVSDILYNVLYKLQEIPKMSIFLAHAIQVLTSKNKDIRNVMTEDENLFRIILDFPKHADETSPVARGCYCKVLEQVIIMSDYDYLSKIKDGRPFLKSLLDITYFTSVFDFLMNFVSTCVYSIIVFLEKNSFTDLLLEYAFEDKCREQSLRIADQLTAKLPRKLPLVKPLLDPNIMLKLLDLGFSHHSCAALEVILSVHSQPQPLSRPMIKAINNQYNRICNFILNTKKFDKFGILLIYLLISIVNDIYCPIENYVQVEPVKIDYSTKQSLPKTENKTTETTSNDTNDSPNHPKGLSKIQKEDILKKSLIIKKRVQKPRKSFRNTNNKLNLDEYNQIRHSLDPSEVLQIHMQISNSTEESIENNNEIEIDENEIDQSEYLNLKRRGNVRHHRKRANRSNFHDHDDLLRRNNRMNMIRRPASFSSSVNNEEGKFGQPIYDRTKDHDNEINRINISSHNSDNLQNIINKEKLNFLSSNPDLLTKNSENDALKQQQNTTNITDETVTNNNQLKALTEENQNQLGTITEEQEMNENQLDVIHKEPEMNQNQLGTITEEQETNQNQLNVIHEEEPHHNQLDVIHEEPEMNQNQLGTITEEQETNQNQLNVIHEEEPKMNHNQFDAINEEEPHQNQLETISEECQPQLDTITEEADENQLDAITEENQTNLDAIAEETQEEEEGNQLETIHEETEHNQLNAISEEPENNELFTITEEPEEEGQLETITEEQEEEIKENQLGTISEEPENNELFTIAEEPEENQNLLDVIHEEPEHNQLYTISEETEENQNQLETIHEEPEHKQLNTISEEPENNELFVIAEEPKEEDLYEQLETIHEEPEHNQLDSISEEPDLNQNQLEIIHEEPEHNQQQADSKPVKFVKINRTYPQTVCPSVIKHHKSKSCGTPTVRESASSLNEVLFDDPLSIIIESGHSHLDSIPEENTAHSDEDKNYSNGPLAAILEHHSNILPSPSSNVEFLSLSKLPSLIHDSPSTDLNKLNQQNNPQNKLSTLTPDSRSLLNDFPSFRPTCNCGNAGAGGECPTPPAQSFSPFNDHKPSNTIEKNPPKKQKGFIHDSKSQSINSSLQFNSRRHSSPYNFIPRSIPFPAKSSSGSSVSSSSSHEDNQLSMDKESNDDDETTTTATTITTTLKKDPIRPAPIRTIKPPVYNKSNLSSITLPPASSIATSTPRRFSQPAVKLLQNSNNNATNTSININGQINLQCDNDDERCSFPSLLNINRTSTVSYFGIQNSIANKTSLPISGFNNRNNIIKSELVFSPFSLLSPDRSKIRNSSPAVSFNRMTDNMQSPMTTDPNTGEKLSLLDFARQSTPQTKSKELHIQHITANTNNTTTINNDNNTNTNNLSDSNDNKINCDLSFNSQKEENEKVHNSFEKVHNSFEKVHFSAIDEDVEFKHHMEEKEELEEKEIKNENNKNSDSVVSIDKNDDENPIKIKNDDDNENDNENEDQEELDNDEIERTLVFLIEAFFANKTNSFLHNSIIQLLTSLFDYTSMISKIITTAQLPKRIIEMQSNKEKISASFWGQLHLMAEFIKSTPETIPDELKEKWDSYIENKYNRDEEIMENSYGNAN